MVLYDSHHAGEVSWRREAGQLWRQAVRLFKGEGSALGYVFIPGGICALWLLVAFLTTSRPSISLEERLTEKHFKVPNWTQYSFLSEWKINALLRSIRNS